MRRILIIGFIYILAFIALITVLGGIIYIILYTESFIKNKRNLEFISSGKYELMSTKATWVAGRICDGEGYKQIGFNIDQEHVNII